MAIIEKYTSEAMAVPALNALNAFGFQDSDIAGLGAGTVASLRTAAAAVTSLTPEGQAILTRALEDFDFFFTNGGLLTDANVATAKAAGSGNLALLQANIGAFAPNAQTTSRTNINWRR